MSLKKNARVLTNLNMPALIDMFLLLIFYMLTFAMLSPNSLNFKLPEKSRILTQPLSLLKPHNIVISKDGKYFLDDVRVSINELEKELAKLIKRRNSNNVSIFIRANANTGHENVVSVMNIAYRLNINAIMTKPTEETNLNR